MIDFNNPRHRLIVDDDFMFLLSESTQEQRKENAKFWSEKEKIYPYGFNGWFVDNELIDEWDRFDNLSMAIATRIIQEINREYHD